MSFSRKFVFTWFKTETPIEYDPSFHQFLQFQEEIAPSTGKHHLQGWMYLHRKTRLATVIKRYPGHHWEVAKGTIADNIAYCTKKESRASEPVCFGNKPSEERYKNGWEQVKEDLINGKSIEQIIADMPNMSIHMRGLQQLRNALKPKISRQGIEIFWVFGAPGTGKSSSVCRLHGEDMFSTRIEPSGQIWFNGYNGEKILRLEEVKGTDDSGLLREVLDHHPFMAPVKLGEPIKAEWTRVYLISNDHPPNFGPIADRIGFVHEVTGESHRKKRVILTSLEDAKFQAEGSS